MSFSWREKEEGVMTFDTEVVLYMLLIGDGKGRDKGRRRGVTGVQNLIENRDIVK